MTELEKKQRRCNTKNKIWFATILVLLGIVAGGSYVYAKYFSEGARWGIAIASGVYFTSNYAMEVTETDTKTDEDTEDDTDTGTDAKEYFETVVSSNYSGGDCDFTFEVRNYENNLLIKEVGVEIPYTVTYWQGETPQNATYTVKVQGDETGTVIPTDKSALTLTNQSIGGGSAYAIEYTISIDAEDGITHTPVPIYVEVQTEDGAIIKKTLGGKMILTSIEKPLSYIESQGFVTPEEIDGDTEEEVLARKFARLQKMAIFTYEVRTVGEVETDDVTEKLRLVWDPTLQQIDLFDETYLERLKTDDASTDGNPNTCTIGEKTYYYITFDVMPYSAQTINFLRGAEFATIETIATTDSGSEAMEALEAAIWAEKYTEQQ